MELGLSLGEASAMEKNTKSSKRLGFCIGLGIGLNRGEEEEMQEEQEIEEEEEEEEEEVSEERETRVVVSDPPVQLDLLPLVAVPRYPSSHLGFPWSSQNGNSEGLCSGQMVSRGFDVNRLPCNEEGEDGCSANSTVSSFQMDFSIYRGSNSKRDQDMMDNNEIEPERASSRASDEEENGLTRKKLRLSKEQSAFLEESFKEHNTLNPKQKLALAKQLNLRPRQVEVWFQNRRARTKLKQTEVDCEYLRRCCETLTEENRRLQKELQELRALKASHPLYMHLPATTLTMCPSCERVATTDNTTSKTTPFSLSKPRFYPFSQHQSTAS